MKTKTISDRLRALRIQHNWKQWQVAGFLNISVPAYSKIENGNTDVSITRLKQLAKIFKVTAAELIEDTDDVLHKENEALKRSLKELFIDLGRNLPTEVNFADLQDVYIEFVRIKSHLLMIWSKKPPELAYMLELHSAEAHRLFGCFRTEHLGQGKLNKDSLWMNWIYIVR